MMVAALCGWEASAVAGLCLVLLVFWGGLAARGLLLGLRTQSSERLLFFYFLFFLLLQGYL